MSEKKNTGDIGINEQEQFVAGLVGGALVLLAGYGLYKLLTDDPVSSRESLTLSDMMDDIDRMSRGGYTL